MRRKLYDTLLKWRKNSAGRSAVLIDGARRVGKSYIVREFGENEYKTFVLIDFSRAAQAIKDFFLNDLEDLDQFFLKISEYYGIRLYPRETLFIFDEVQAFPRAREAIKALVEDGRFDYIETGSLISINRNVRDIVIPSEEDRVKMHPMDFEEFLWAKGDSVRMDFVREHFKEMKPCGESFHRKMMDAFREYMVVGGMPQAVETFIRTGDIGAVDAVKRRILNLYREDIDKYAGRQALKTKLVFDGIPSQLSKHERTFRLSALNRNARLREYEEAFLWLEESRTINTCYRSTEPNVGLNLNAERSAVKCYAADTGLLVSQAFDERELVSEQIHRRLLSDAIELNKGMFVENVVAQMLKAAGHNLFFYSKTEASNRSERMEIDFLITRSEVGRRRNICPVEVKSARSSSHESLNRFCAKYRDYLGTPFVLHPKDLQVKDGVTYLPLYMAPCL